MENKFISKDDTFYHPICNLCKHHIEGLKCKAFDVIPNEIILGENDHQKPLPNQNNDLVYEPS